MISDFGFANSFHYAADGTIDDLMSTSCGSPCYAAPELVVSDSKYIGRKVDVWSCGVILYAMLSGYLPFDDDPENPDGDNITQLYKYITTTPLTFPEYVQPMPRDLLRKILVSDPTKRIDLNNVRSHAWLAPHAHFLSVTPEEWDRSFLHQSQLQQNVYKTPQPTQQRTQQIPNSHSHTAFTTPPLPKTVSNPPPPQTLPTLPNLPTTGSSDANYLTSTTSPDNNTNVNTPIGVSIANQYRMPLQPSSTTNSSTQIVSSFQQKSSTQQNSHGLPNETSKSYIPSTVQDTHTSTSTPTSHSISNIANLTPSSSAFPSHLSEHTRPTSMFIPTTTSFHSRTNPPQAEPIVISSNSAISSASSPQAPSSAAQNYMTHSRRHSVQTNYSKGVTHQRFSNGYNSSNPTSMANPSLAQNSSINTVESTSTSTLASASALSTSASESASASTLTQASTSTSTPLSKSTMASTLPDVSTQSRRPLSTASTSSGDDMLTSLDIGTLPEIPTPNQSQQQPMVLQQPSKQKQNSLYHSSSHSSSNRNLITTIDESESSQTFGIPLSVSSTTDKEESHPSSSTSNFRDKNPVLGITDSLSKTSVSMPSSAARLPPATRKPRPTSFQPSYASYTSSSGFSYGTDSGRSSLEKPMSFPLPMSSEPRVAVNPDTALPGEISRPIFKSSATSSSLAGIVTGSSKSNQNSGIPTTASFSHFSTPPSESTHLSTSMYREPTTSKESISTQMAQKQQLPPLPQPFINTTHGSVKSTQSSQSTRVASDSGSPNDSSTVGSHSTVAPPTPPPIEASPILPTIYGHAEIPKEKYPDEQTIPSFDFPSQTGINVNSHSSNNLSATLPSYPKKSHKRAPNSISYGADKFFSRLMGGSSDTSNPNEVTSNPVVYGAQMQIPPPNSQETISTGSSTRHRYTKSVIVAPTTSISSSGVNFNSSSGYDSIGSNRSTNTTERKRFSFMSLYSFGGGNTTGGGDKPYKSHQTTPSNGFPVTSDHSTLEHPSSSTQYDSNLQQQQFTASHSRHVSIGHGSRPSSYYHHYNNSGSNIQGPHMVMSSSSKTPDSNSSRQDVKEQSTARKFVDFFKRRSRIVA